MKTPTSRAGRPVRVALDLLGGDLGPDVVVDAALDVAAGFDDASTRGVEILLVGPLELTASLLSARGVDAPPPGTSVVAASSAVAMDDDPINAVRSRRDCSIRVATDLVRDGDADALVSVGHTGATLAAATFSLGRLPGVTRPAVAVLVPTLHGEVVLLDAGGTPDASPDLLAQFALAGSAYASALGLRGDDERRTAPRVGLLTIGTEPGKGDQLRRATARLLGTLPVQYVGGVEGASLSVGGTADVIVTDGFTGNVVLKAIEGAAEASLVRASEAYADLEPARQVARTLLAGTHSGALLLGVDGVCVVGHGASTADEIVANIALARRLVDEQVVQRTAGALAALAAGARRLPEVVAEQSGTPA